MTDQKQRREARRSMPTGESVRLEASISGPQYFAVAFGCIVGVAWIVVLGDLVGRAGPGGAAIALGIGGLAVLLIAFCYAEMGARRPAAGGELVYAYDLAGPSAAYAIGWTLTLIYAAACAFEAIAMGQLVGLLFPQVEGSVLYSVLGHEVRLGEILIGLGFAVGLWALNACGVRFAASAQQWVTAARIALILAFLALAIAYANPANLLPFVSGDGPGAQTVAVLAVMGVAPFWYAGFNVVAAATEESATSLDAVGRALVFAIVGSAIFYIALVFAVSALVPAARLSSLELPAAEAFEFATGSRLVAKAVIITAILGNLTAWNSFIMAGSRVLFALGRAQLSPASFARVGMRSRVPTVGVALVSAVSILALPLGRGFVLPLVNISSACFGVTYLITCLALLKARRETKNIPAYTVPGGMPVISAAVLCSMLITFVALAQPLLAVGGRLPAEWITISAWMAVAAVIWFLSRDHFRAVREIDRAALLHGLRP